MDKKRIKLIADSFQGAEKTFESSAGLLVGPISEAAEAIVRAFRNKRKMLVCGNGGSAAESQHLVAELLGRFEITNRRPLPAIALTADTSFLTAWSNDVGFDDVFARQIAALGQQGDVLFCLSTSGRSRNINKAIKTASEKGMTTIAVTGKDGGEAAFFAGINVIVPSANTQRIQEVHLFIIHILCTIIEAELFGEKEDMLAKQKNARVHRRGAE